MSEETMEEKAARLLREVALTSTQAELMKQFIAVMLDIAKVERLAGLLEGTLGEGDAENGHFTAILIEHGDGRTLNGMWSGSGQNPASAALGAERGWGLCQPDEPAHDTPSQPQEAPGDDATPGTGE